MNILKIISVATALVLSASVNSALVDKGTYTTDTASELDWLDLSITVGQSYNATIANKRIR